MALNLVIDVQDARWKQSFKPYTKNIRVACEAVSKKGEVAVVLADDKFVQQLNHQYRSKNKPTNVLSFCNEEAPLGDIILSYDTIKREAEEQGKRFKDHATHLIVHGMLHLLGHDHEKEEEAAVMEKKEINILKKLGVSNPYL